LSSVSLSGGISHHIPYLAMEFPANYVVEYSPCKSCEKVFLINYNKFAEVFNFYGFSIDI